ncbi:hypothetical protein IAU60_006217 [Kwoniella sp. DSM 27419]
MHHLARTRSQHLVSSPRRTSSPLIGKHTLFPHGRHPPKRRRLGSQSFTFARPAQPTVSDSGSSTGSPADIAEEDEEEAPRAESSTSRSRSVTGTTLDGPGTSAKGRYAKTNGKRADPSATARGRARGKGKGKAKAVDVFGADGLATNGDMDEDPSASPKKRKRFRDPDSDDESGSWIETDEDEEEPEFIAESDQHLIESAPSYALHRLRKAELIRLWKVAGMWEGDDEASVTSLDEETDAGMGKKELVEGLVAARKPLDRLISPLPTSPSRNSRLRSTTSSTQHSPASSSQSDSGPQSHRDGPDAEVTPKAAPRTRSRVRLPETDPARTAPRRLKDRRRIMPRNTGRGRSKSVNMNADNGDKKARFGEHVESPGKALTDHRTRRSSTLSSAYTTTDVSNAEDTAPPRQTPRRPRRQAVARGSIASRRTRSTKSGHSADRKNTDGHANVDDDREDESEDGEETPLVQRLRPRGTGGSFVGEASSEVDADDEDNETEADADVATSVDDDEVNDDEDDGDGSPAPLRQLRSRDTVLDSDVSINSSNKSAVRSLPTRGAKKKALRALKADASDSEVDVEMADDATEVGDGPNDHAANEGQHVDEPPQGSRTRLTRRASRASAVSRETNDQKTMEGDFTTPHASPEPIDEDTQMTPGQIHTTRSGKLFGVMQSRRRRLKQEAREDPDMVVEEDDEDEDDDADDADETDEDDSFQADVDLTDATVASLTRLLRDELVELCEARGIEVGGTKPQLAKALIEWRDEHKTSSRSNPSSQATARPGSSPHNSRATANRSKSGKIIHAIGSNVHVPGKTTPVLLRDHIHAHDPATPQHSDDSKPINSEAELNLDLSELGLEDSIIKPQHLVKLEKIGSGGFKDVFVGKLRGRKVAISEFREHLSEMDIRELKLLAEFSHPNIVRFRGICIPEDSTHVPCMLVSELCENGDLFDYIRNVDCPSYRRLLNLMLDIARGLEYLHTRRPAIIHRDCKSSNILINRQGQAKVGDFGLARVKNSTRSMIRSLVGTVNWQAPELWHAHPRYDYKVDVFSAAMVYWEMMAGWIGDKKYPWEGHNEHYIYDAVGKQQKRPSVAGLRKHWGEEPVKLMERMWHQDAAERPTMTDVVADLESLIAEC